MDHGHSHDIETACDHDHQHAGGAGEHDHGHEHVAEAAGGDHGHDHDRAEHDHSHGHADDGHQHSATCNHADHHDTKAAQPRKSLYSRLLGGVLQEGMESHEIDNNFRSAFFHVMADAFVSCLVIIGIIISGNVPVLYWADPVMGLVGAGVILSWALQLMADSSANLLDVRPNETLVNKLYASIEKDGTVVKDFHLWRLGPGHLGLIVSLVPPAQGAPGVKYDAYYYHGRLRGYRAVSHATVEVLDH